MTDICFSVNADFGGGSPVALDLDRQRAAG
jgi:hypothetical protein